MNDRGFQVGDTVILKEWDNIRYSGREIKGKIKYILDDKFIGIAEGYVILSLEVTAWQPLPEPYKGESE